MWSALTWVGLKDVLSLLLDITGNTLLFFVPNLIL